MPSTVRDYLDHFIGRTVVDITSHDVGVDPRSTWHITFMFDDGSYVRIPLGDDGLPWSTTNRCLDHAGCIAAEDPPPDPGLLIRDSLVPAK